MKLRTILEGGGVIEFTDDMAKYTRELTTILSKIINSNWEELNTQRSISRITDQEAVVNHERAVIGPNNTKIRISPILINNTNKKRIKGESIPHEWPQTPQDTGSATLAIYWPYTYGLKDLETSIAHELTHAFDPETYEKNQNYATKMYETEKSDPLTLPGLSKLTNLQHKAGIPGQIIGSAALITLPLPSIVSYIIALMLTRYGMSRAISSIASLYYRYKYKTSSREIKARGGEFLHQLKQQLAGVNTNADEVMAELIKREKSWITKIAKWLGYDWSAIYATAKAEIQKTLDNQQN